MSFADLLASVDAQAKRALGEAIVYTPGVGDPVTVQAIFDELYRPVDVGTPGVSSGGPAVFVRLSELPSDPFNDVDARVTVRGVVYRVSEPEPDGQGAAILRLHRVT